MSDANMSSPTIELVTSFESPLAPTQASLTTMSARLFTLDSKIGHGEERAPTRSHRPVHFVRDFSCIFDFPQCRICSCRDVGLLTATFTSSSPCAIAAVPPTQCYYVPQVDSMLSSTISMPLPAPIIAFSTLNPCHCVPLNAYASSKYMNFRC